MRSTARTRSWRSIRWDRRISRKGQVCGKSPSFWPPGIGLSATVCGQRWWDRDGVALAVVRGGITEGFLILPWCFSDLSKVNVLRRHIYGDPIRGSRRSSHSSILIFEDKEPGWRHTEATEGRFEPARRRALGNWSTRHPRRQTPVRTRRCSPTYCRLRHAPGRWRHRTTVPRDGDQSAVKL